MKVTVKWETTVTYEHVMVEIDDAALAGYVDLESYVDDNLDELVADLEEDYEMGYLTSQVDERRLVQVDGDEPDEGD